MSYKSFETERLVLRPTSVNDSAFFLKLLNMPKWLKYIGDRNVKTLNEAKSYIEGRILPQFEKLGFGNYTVVRKEDNTVVGSCGLYDREGLEGVDIGFAFLPEYEKLGYAFEGVSKLMQVAFDEFGIDKISAITLEENTSSRRLLEKLKFELKGPIRIPNDEVELLLYRLAIGR